MQEQYCFGNTNDPHDGTWFHAPGCPLYGEYQYGFPHRVKDPYEDEGGEA